METVGTALQEDLSELLDGFGSLVDMSLLQVRDVAGEPWFSMLETIQEFAQEELRASGEEAILREAHARSAVNLVEEIAPELAGPDQLLWTARLTAGQDNIRAALRWLLDAGRLDDAGRILFALWRFWWAQGQMPEARRWAEEVLARHSGTAPLAQAQASYVAGFAAVLQGDEAAAELLAKALVLSRTEGDRSIQGHTLVLLGFLAPLSGDIARGIELMRQGQQVCREVGDNFGVGSALTGLSALFLLAGDLDEAERYAEEHLTLARRMGDLLSMARAWDSRATIALVRQDRDRAAALLHESIALARQVGQPELIMYGLMGLAAVAARDDPARAARLFGASEAMREAAGVTIWPARRTQYDPATEAARDLLGATAFDEAWSEGGAMSREQAIAYGLGPDAAFD
jgi:non-specific serine/threonine protein kinase